MTTVCGVCRKWFAHTLSPPRVGPASPADFNGKPDP